MVVRTDENTQFLTFLFDSPKNTAEVIVDDVPYRITFCGGRPGQRRLDDSGFESQSGQWFNHYTFDVEWEEPDK